MVHLPTELLFMILEYVFWRPIHPEDSENPIISIYVLQGSDHYDPQDSTYSLLKRVSPKWKDIIDVIASRVIPPSADTLLMKYFMIEDGYMIPPTLRHLVYDRPHLRDDDEAPKPVFALSNLVSLSLHIWPSFKIYRAIDYGQWSLPLLQTLHLDLLNPRPGDMDNLLSNVGATITTLSFQVQHFSRGTYSEEPLTEAIWAWCPNLTTLRLTLWQFRRPPPPIGPRIVDIYLDERSVGAAEHAKEVAPWNLHLARWGPALRYIHLDRAWCTTHGKWVCGLEQWVGVLEGMNMALYDIHGVPSTAQEVQARRRREHHDHITGWGP